MNSAVHESGVYAFKLLAACHCATVESALNISAANCSTCLNVRDRGSLTVKMVNSMLSNYNISHLPRMGIFPFNSNPLIASGEKTTKSEFRKSMIDG